MTHLPKKFTQRSGHVYLTIERGLGIFGLRLTLLLIDNVQTIVKLTKNISVLI